MLAEQGRILDIKTVRNVVKRMAARARLAQEQEESSLYWDTQEIKGRRVVVSTDGGRLRIRKKKRGPKTKKGYSRFTGEWKEPKLFIIYIADDEGRQDKTFCPYLDGTLNGSDAVFGMLVYYLKKLEVSAADKLLFVADGAIWIWRTPAVMYLGCRHWASQILATLMIRLGISSKRLSGAALTRGAILFAMM